MLFKFIEKPIEITAFVNTDYTFANTYSPIKSSSHFIPSWWKNTPKSYDYWNNNSHKIHRTTKSCLGIIGTFQTGYILPMWSDLKIKIYEDETWRYQFSDNMSKLESHSDEQTPNFYNSYLKLKINSPWFLQMNEDVKLLYCDPFYCSNEKNYYLTYGISPSINKIYATNIFMFIEKKCNEIFIKHNTPILHLIPLTKKEVKFKTEVISREEMTKKLSIIGTPITFLSKGLNMMKILRNQKNG